MWTIITMKGCSAACNSEQNTTSDNVMKEFCSLFQEHLFSTSKCQNVMLESYNYLLESCSNSKVTGECAWGIWFVFLVLFPGGETLTCQRCTGMCHFDDPPFRVPLLLQRLTFLTPSVNSYALHFAFFKKSGIFRPISL